MAMDKARYQAFKDGLSQDELDVVKRGEAMPQEMAAPYLAVAMMREMAILREEIAAMRRPLWRSLLAPAAVAGAFVAGLLGMDPRGLGG